MANTAILAIRIISDASKAKKDLDATATAAQKFGSGMKKLAVPAAAVGGALVAFGISAVKAASDAQQSLGATQTIFGKFSKSVIADSNKAATTYGLSANQYRESANLIGSLFKNQGVAQDQLAGKTKAMITTASDLAAVFGGKTSDAVEALSSAFKGEFDPLEKYGISLKQSTVNSEAFAVAGVKTQSAFNKLSNAQQKAAIQQATTNLIMKQSKSAQGQFAKQTSTLAEKQQIAAAQFENLKVTLGNNLLPVVSKVMDRVSKFVTIMSRHTTVVKASIIVVGSLAGAILGINAAMKVWSAGMTVANAIQKIWNSTALLSIRVWAIDAAAWIRSTAATVAHTAAVIAANVAQKAIAIGTKAWAAAQWLLNAAMTANPIGLVVVAIVALVAIFVVAYKKSDTFRTIVQAAFNGIKTAAVAVANFFTQTIPAAFNAIVSAAGVVIGWVKSNWPLLLAILAGPIGIAVALVIKYWSQIKSATVAAFNAVKSAVSAAVNAVKSVISKVWSAIVAVVRGYVNAYKTVITSVFNAVKSVVSRAVSGVKSTVSGAWNSVKSATSNAWNGVKDAVSSGIGRAVDAVKDLPGKIISIIGGFSLAGAGAKLMGGLVDGIGSKINAAVDKVKAGVQKIKDLLPGSPIKTGPLKSWNNGGAGKRLMALLAGGIEKGAVQAKDAMSSAAGRIAGVGITVPSVTIGTSTAAPSYNPTAKVTTSGDASAASGPVTIELHVGNEYLGKFIATQTNKALGKQARRIVAGVSA